MEYFILERYSQGGSFHLNEFLGSQEFPVHKADDKVEPRCLIPGMVIVFDEQHRMVNVIHEADLETMNIKKVRLSSHGHVEQWMIDMFPECRKMRIVDCGVSENLDTSWIEDFRLDNCWLV